MKLRTFSIAAGAPLLLLVALRPWSDDAAPAGSPAPAVAPRAHALPDGRDRAAARVQRELAELREEVSSLGPAAARQEDRPPARELSPEEQQEQDQQRVAAQASLLVKTFAADPRDPSWSPQAERSVRDAFATAALPGARLDEVACGGTLCRITVSFDSIERRDQGFAAVVELARWPTRGFGDVSPEDPLRYVVYAARDQESFPAAW